MSEPDEAWLGWRDDKLVAIELPGFHVERFRVWMESYDRVMITTEAEAVRRWQEAHQRNEEA